MQGKVHLAPRQLNLTAGRGQRVNRKRSGNIIGKKLPYGIQDKAAKRLDIHVELVLHLLHIFKEVIVARLLFGLSYVWPRH